MHRLVQAEADADLLDGLGGGIVSGDYSRGIARGDAYQEEHEQDYDTHDGERRQDASHNVGKHGGLPGEDGPRCERRPAARIARKGAYFLVRFQNAVYGVVSMTLLKRSLRYAAYRKNSPTGT